MRSVSIEPVTLRLHFGAEQAEIRLRYNYANIPISVGAAQWMNARVGNGEGYRRSVRYGSLDLWKRNFTLIFPHRAQHQPVVMAQSD